MTGHCAQAVQCPPICACRSEVEGEKADPPPAAVLGHPGHVPYPAWLRGLRAAIGEMR